VLGEHVPSLVREDDPQMLLVEELDELGVDDDYRPSSADRESVRDGILGEIEIGRGLEIERRVRARVRAPDVSELILSETHCGAEHAAPHRTLVAEFDQLAHDRVEMRNALQRRGRSPVSGMLVRLPGYALQLIALLRKRRHGRRTLTETARLHPETPTSIQREAVLEQARREGVGPRRSD
jgi:hypothetical protein